MQATESATENLPVRFSESVAQQILDQIADGKILPRAIQSVGLSMTSSNFIRAVLRNPKLAQAYDEARVAQASALAEQALEVADTERDSARARNMIDVRKWLAAKLNPRQFGDRIDLNIEQSVSIKSALEAAESRILRPMSDLINQRQSQVIDLEAEIIDGRGDNESARPERRDAGLNSLDDLLA